MTFEVDKLLPNSRLQALKELLSKNERPTSQKGGAYGLTPTGESKHICRNTYVATESPARQAVSVAASD